MTQQFTASEVHAHVDECNSRGAGLPPKTHAMLRALADMLEAREKAVPIGWICSDDLQELNSNCGESDGGADGIEILVASHPFAMCNVPVYTHSAPSDADRLAEALRRTEYNLRLAVQGKPVRDMTETLTENATALAAHSAQAQPPADQFDPERNVRPGDVGTELQTAEQDAADFGTGFEVDGRRVAPERVRIFRGEHAAQPPAASVPDKRASSDYECTETFNGPDPYSSGHRDGWNACREAMLAAQENPNGL